LKKKKKHKKLLSFENIFKTIHIETDEQIQLSWEDLLRKQKEERDYFIQSLSIFQKIKSQPEKLFIETKPEIPSPTSGSPNTNGTSPNVSKQELPNIKNLKEGKISNPVTPTLKVESKKNK